MKDIKECFESTTPISSYLFDKSESRVDEGLKDLFNIVKDKFKSAWQYLKGIVTKIGVYFLPVDNNGDILPSITPMTSGQAYKDGVVDKHTTFVCLDKEGSKITGLRTKISDVIKNIYTKESTLNYWSVLNESVEGDQANINEVKLQSEDPEAKYSRICDNKELQEEILMHIKNPKLAKLLIWGAPGIGKTAIVMEVVKTMQKSMPNYNMIFKTLSNETPDNFTLPKYITIDNQDFATDVPKTWLPVYKPTGNSQKDAELDANCGNGLLFIDELSRATPQVLNVVLPLVNEGMFNGYKLGSGWTIVCASNRAEDETSGQTTIGNALANRFDQVFYEPTVHTWKEWAEKQNFISPLLLQWLSMPETENMSGGKFYYLDPNEEMDGATPTTLMCTPRSWTNAMRKLALYSHTGTLEGFTIFDIPNRIIQRTLNSSGIPATAVDNFMAFLEVIRGVGNFDQIVYDVWKNGGKGFKVDKKTLNKIILPLGQMICSAHADSLPTTEEFKNLSQWLVDQNSDQLASCVLDVFKNVFGVGLDENLQNGMFTIGKRIANEGKDNPNLDIFRSTFVNFCSKWGVKFEDLVNHDYLQGLQIISKKYKEAFKNAVVDQHVDALG